MKTKLKRRLAALALCAALTLGGATTAYAYTYGNHLSGASSVEIYQVMYKGSAWNYPGSGYNYTWFKYVRNGAELLKRGTHRGKVSGYVWDDLINWGPSHTTKFYWGQS